MLDDNISLAGRTILVTGVAGFIGSALAERLLSDEEDIHLVGIDSITDYYDVSIKRERLARLQPIPTSLL